MQYQPGQCQGSMSRAGNSIRDRTKALDLVGSGKRKNKGQKEAKGEFCRNRALVKEGQSPDTQGLKKTPQWRQSK